MAPYFSLAFVFLCPSFQSRDPWGSGSTASTFCSHLPLNFLQCGFSSSTHRLPNLQRALTFLPLFRLCRCFLKSHSILEILSSIGFYVGTSSWSLSWRFPGTVSASLNEGYSWPSILDSNFIKSIAQCHSYTYDIYIYFFSADLSEFQTEVTTVSPPVCTTSMLNSVCAKLKISSFFTNFILL